MLDSPLYQLAALLALVAVSDWLGRHTWLRQLGGALLVIVLAAVCVNVGLLPKHVIGADSPPATQLVYDEIFRSLAQIGIFWLLLAVSLREVLRSGWPLLGLFLLGSCSSCDCLGGGTTTVTADSLPAGTYYVVVEGLDASDDDATFDLTLECIDPCLSIPQISCNLPVGGDGGNLT